MDWLFVFFFVLNIVCLVLTIYAMVKAIDIYGAEDKGKLRIVFLIFVIVFLLNVLYPFILLLFS